MHQEERREEMPAEILSEQGLFFNFFSFFNSPHPHQRCYQLPGITGMGRIRLVSGLEHDSKSLVNTVVAFLKYKACKNL